MSSILSNECFLSYSNSIRCEVFTAMNLERSSSFWLMSIRVCFMDWILGILLASLWNSRCSVMHSEHSISKHSRHVCRMVYNGWISQLLPFKSEGSFLGLPPWGKPFVDWARQEDWPLVYLLFRKFIILCRGFFLFVQYYADFMGSSESFVNRFELKYSFIDTVEDLNFGKIRVFRKKEINFDYVMILEKAMLSDGMERFREQITSIHRGLLQKDQPMILRIFHYEFSRAVTGCNSDFVRLYIEYFNFTLKDLIRLCTVNGQAFTPDEIRYVIDSAIKTYYFFKNVNSNYLSVSSRCIFLSLEGQIRFSPIRIDQFFQEKNSTCIECIPEGQQVFLQKNQKQFISEVQHLYSDLLSLSGFADPNFNELKQMYQRIMCVKTITQMKESIKGNRAECLNMCRKANESSDHSTHHEVHHGMPQKRSLRDSRARHGLEHDKC